MIIDAHMHVFTAGLNLDGDDDFDRFVAGVLRAMDVAGVSAGIVAQGISHPQLERLTLAHGSRFRGLVQMVPDNDRNLATIDRFEHNPHIIGIKVYPNAWPESRFRRPLQPVFDRIRGRGWIVQVHSNPVTMAEVGLPLEVISLARNSDLPVVMGHQFHQLYTLARVPENLYFDTSCVQNQFAGTPYAPHLRRLWDRLGDHLFWGSDYPDYPFAVALGALRSFGFNAQEQEQLCHHNLKRFLNRYARCGF
jgi:predicted TIM-barrel fold metal-dependent hydrolase